MELTFSNQVKEVIAKSRLICLEMGYDAITEEMFILGILYDIINDNSGDRNGAVMCMMSMQTNIETLITYLEMKIGTKLKKVDTAPTGNVPLTKQAEKVLKRSTLMAIRFGEHGTIDTIHLLGSYLNEMDRVERKEFLNVNEFDLLTVSRNIVFDDQIKPNLSLKDEDSIEVQLAKSKERILRLKAASQETVRHKAKLKVVKPLSLIFDMDEYTPEEIKNIIALIGEIYHEQSGDHLVIKGMSQFQVVQELACV
ncbi:hypothetical protein FA048_12145 [Pedobacter polaris]|uniref:Clp R domain-containing protein n=1 Tax=Pedobacter polaris TaxID=2571273 RepID=A0A4U1CQM9_9SPHI|nr:hypothetical protein [Pedobacter polaris]TKC07911.1 hypothetical protein FA048_12145 [Pedobacter polaris]